MSTSSTFNLGLVNNRLGVLSDQIDDLGPYNGLDSDSTAAALSAAQGKVLNQQISDLKTPQAIYGVALTTVSSAFSDGALAIYKIGRLAFIKTNFRLSSNLQSGTLLTVPESVRPNIDFTFGVFCSSGNTVAGYFELLTTGQLVCYGSPATNVWCNYCTMYITAN